MDDTLDPQDDLVQSTERTEVITIATDIVAAYVSNNRVPAAEMPALLSNVHAAVVALGKSITAVDAGPEKPTAAQIRKSVKPDALISFIDGKPYKTLKRHLTGNGLTMDEYRERYGLPRDYPSTAASYSEQRSALAKSLGLGQKRRKAAEVAETPPKARKANKTAAADEAEAIALD
jgi:predicted transcriptional regulator